MREIKFRAWDKTENRMVIGSHYLYMDISDGEILDQNKDDFRKDLILMQSTGLKDKNGKEIYEGDVVKVLGHAYEDNFITQVIYKKGGFWLNRDFIGNWQEYMLKVIGNIYENPDLLKEST